MICPRCNNIVNDGFKNCVYCGYLFENQIDIASGTGNHNTSNAENDLRQSADEKHEEAVARHQDNYSADNSKSGKPMCAIIALIIIVIILIIIGVAILLFSKLLWPYISDNYISNNGKATEVVDYSPAEDELGSDFSINETTEEDNSKENDLTDVELDNDDPQDDASETNQDNHNSERQENDNVTSYTFMPGIENDTYENYGLACNDDMWEYYSDKYLSFTYPTCVYNWSQLDDSDYTAKYGANIECVSFEGNKGSKLSFSVSERYDSMSLENFKDYVKNSETNEIYYSENPILRDRKEKNYYSLIITGYSNDNNNIVYRAFKITESQIYIMNMEMPDWEDTADKNYKFYVNERIFRGCYFTDASAPIRSYGDYMDGK